MTWKAYTVQILVAVLAAAGVVVGAVVAARHTFYGKILDTLSGMRDKSEDRNNKLTDRLDAQEQRIHALEAEIRAGSLITIEREKRIAHLENEIEQLQWQIGRLEGERTQDTALIAGLQGQIVAKQDRILELEAQIAAHTIIGVGEPPPVKRQTS